MSAKLFLFINAIIIFIIIWRIILKAFSKSEPSIKKSEEGPRMEFFDIFTGRTGPREKNLSCSFTHNGVHYDAYEVLGVPAGAPKTIWQAAFRDLSRRAEADQKHLLSAALQALEKS